MSDAEMESAVDEIYLRKEGSGGRYTSKQHAEAMGEGEAFRAYNRNKHKRWREANPQGARRLSTRTHLKRFYGLTEAQYDDLFRKQHGCCAVCSLRLISQTDYTREFKGHPPNEVGRVDHDHQTGAVRGLLCFGCNVGLGKFRDDQQLLLRAAGYLQSHATSLAQPSGPRESLSEIEPVMGPRFERSRESRRDDLSPFS